MIFAAISALLSIFYEFASMSDKFYSSNAYDFYNNASSFVAVAKIITFAVFIIIQIFKKDDSKTDEKIEAKTETK